MEKVRIDRWLWSVRVFKTRSDATAACRGGHVRINGSPAKPAAPVKVGDRIGVTGREHTKDLEVIRLIDKRVGAAIAAECVIDHSPPPVVEERLPPVFQRDRGAGRPTKRDRRQLDRLRGRS